MLYMYSYKNILYIISAIAASEKAMHYSREFTSPIEFLEANEQMPFNATITLLIAIAEEIKKTDKQLLQTQPTIQWQKIADMRNVLAHHYRGVDDEIVFDIVKNELPKLQLVFIQFIKLFPIDEVKELLQTEQYKHLYSIIF